MLQFLIVLSETDPLVWRRIQVPEEYSFWDLHVAIQDAMGWLDYHLHEFRVFHARRRQLDRLGIPDEECQDKPSFAPDWKAKISDYFNSQSMLEAPPALYVYDFGDDWHHILMFEGVLPVEVSVAYPRCVGGARACPPEDCGGVNGFAGFLAAIADPTHEEHEQLVEWSGGAYDPAAFEPSRIRFDDPRQRWKKAFQE
ncbi:MAG: plasmid pRiA4b ORF-3 family protein [Bacteroidota bacterium]